VRPAPILGDGSRSGRVCTIVLHIRCSLPFPDRFDLLGIAEGVKKRFADFRSAASKPSLNR
jgi:hypothetical protein